MDLILSCPNIKTDINRLDCIYVPYLRNEFHFSDVHEMINVIGSIQVIHFEMNPWLSYFHESRTTKFLYFHFYNKYLIYYRIYLYFRIYSNLISFIMFHLKAF